MTEPITQLIDAQFGYGHTVAVRADMRIDAGEVVALLGANGSGKSTLVKGMLGLATQHGGRVEWFGQPLAEADQRWRIGYVPQRELAPSPIPVTVSELVRCGWVARRRRAHRRSSNDRHTVDEALHAVGLDIDPRTPVRQLSGGQQRRVMVARALAPRPEVLVLDEPFAGVDHESQKAMTETFAKLAMAGATLLIVLHELGPMVDVVTRTVCLEEGLVAFDGAPAHEPHGTAHEHDPNDVHHAAGRIHDAVPRVGLIAR
jgi:zinc transport system ATP-binding protein